MHRLLTIVLCLFTFAAQASEFDRGCSHIFLQNSFSPGSKYQLQSNKTVRSPSGQTVAIRGVQMFDYLFITFEYRGYNGTVPINQAYRQIDNPSGKGPGTSISEPTYNAKYYYKNHAYVAAQLRAARDIGINFIRIFVEPAVQLASVSYVDPSNGRTYPPDIVMLDDIVNTANAFGIIVDLTQGRDEANWDPAFPELNFMTYIGGHYASNPMVWINTSNEFSGTPWQTSSSTTIPNPHAGNVSDWVSVESLLVRNLRLANFIGPIILNDPNFASNINAIYSTITTTTPFNTDGNIVYGIHEYTTQLSGTGATLSVQDSWVNQSLPAGAQTKFANYIGIVPMFVEETGNSCASGGTCNDVYSPEFGKSLNTNTWLQMQYWDQDFLRWTASKSVPNGPLFGATVRSWFEYTSGNPDPTSLWLNGTKTIWQHLVQNNLWGIGKDDCRRRHFLNTFTASP